MNQPHVYVIVRSINVGCTSERHEVCTADSDDWDDIDYFCPLSVFKTSAAAEKRAEKIRAALSGLAKVNS